LVWCWGFIPWQRPGCLKRQWGNFSGRRKATRRFKAGATTGGKSCDGYGEWVEPCQR